MGYNGLEKKLDVSKLKPVEGVVVFRDFGNSHANDRYNQELSAAIKKFGKEQVPAILSLGTKKNKQIHPYLAYSKDRKKLQQFYYKNELEKFNMGVSHFTGK